MMRIMSQASIVSIKSGPLTRRNDGKNEVYFWSLSKNWEKFYRIRFICCWRSRFRIVVSFISTRHIENQFGEAINWLEKKKKREARTHTHESKRRYLKERAFGGLAAAERTAAENWRTTAPASSPVTAQW